MGPCSHRSNYSREAELAVLYPHIATYLNDDDLLTFLSIFRAADPDRISIARNWEGELKITRTEYRPTMIDNDPKRTVYREHYKLVSAETLRGLTSPKKVLVNELRSSRGTERTLRLFRIALMTNAFSNLEHLNLNFANNHMNAVSAFWYDFLELLPTLKKLKSLVFKNDDDTFFAGGRLEKLLESMSQLPMLENFSVGFLPHVECRMKWSASVVRTFLRLKWPSLKKLLTHQVTFKAPVSALDRRLLADAFANGHFPCVTSMEIGEFLGGDLYSCLPEDVSQIKHLTIQGRILRSPLLNFTIPMENFDIQTLSGGGGTITASKFSGLTCLDLSGLHVSDVMPLYQNIEDQGMYCLAFHNNTLRALNNLTTVLGNSKMESMELSHCTLAPSYNCPYKYFAKKLSFAAQVDAHRDLKDARLRCFCSLAQCVRTLSITDIRGMWAIAIPGQLDDPNTEDPREFRTDSSAGICYDSYGEDIRGESVLRSFFSCLAEAQLHPPFTSRHLQEINLSSVLLPTFRSMLLEYYGEDSPFEEIEQIEEEIEKLQDNLNEAKKEKVKNRSVIANISCLEVEISDLQSRIFSIERVSKFLEDPQNEFSITESECRDCMDSFEGVSSYSGILSPFENLRKITVDYIPDDSERLDLDALVQLTPPQVKQVIVNERSWFEGGVFPSLEHYKKTTTTTPKPGSILCYFPRVNPPPPETETQFTLNIRTYGRPYQFSVKVEHEEVAVAHRMERERRD